MISRRTRITILQSAEVLKWYRHVTQHYNITSKYFWEQEHQSTAAVDIGIKINHNAVLTAVERLLCTHEESGRPEKICPVHLTKVLDLRESNAVNASEHSHRSLAKNKKGKIATGSSEVLRSACWWTTAANMLNSSAVPIRGGCFRNKDPILLYS